MAQDPMPTRRRRSLLTLFALAFVVIVAVAIGSILVALWRAAPEYGGEVDALSCAIETQGVLTVRSNTTRDSRIMRTERR